MKAAFNTLGKMRIAVDRTQALFDALEELVAEDTATDDAEEDDAEQDADIVGN